MPKRTDIKSILIITIIACIFANSAEADECRNVNYVVLSLNSYSEYVLNRNSAAGMEDFDAMVDLLVKDTPECLKKAYPLLLDKTKAIIIKRAEEMINSPICKKDYHPDMEDYDWCQPTLRERKEQCFTKNGKPFDWCKAYSKILNQLKATKENNHAKKN